MAAARPRSWHATSKSSPAGASIYRDTPVEEMDLPAILARAPELCLIDELAHTNAAGVEHEKRYQDVETCSKPASTSIRRSTCSTWRASTTRLPS